MEGVKYRRVRRRIEAREGKLVKEKRTK